MTSSEEAKQFDLPELPKLPGRLYWQLSWTGDLLGEGSVMVRIRRRGGRKHGGDTAVAAVRLDEGATTEQIIHAGGMLWEQYQQRGTNEEER